MVSNLLNNGLIIVDKPPGHSSHEISAFVKKITGAKRTGHAGTLDPNVSGVLPIALGRATKLLRYIAGSDKTYIGIIKFKEIQSREKIESLFEQFTGEIIQTPPKISAVRKIPRKRRVHRLLLLEISEENPRLALFEAKVGAGTYIRTLCEDIGKLCNGARMEELRRIAVGEIDEMQAIRMEEIVDSMWVWKNKKDDSRIKKIIQPPEKFIYLPKVFIKESALSSIKSGAQLMRAAIESFQFPVSRLDKVALFSRDRFIGVGVSQINSDELEEKKRGIVIKLERVHI
jgi:H/ACA ribonucleoprotein complex subunit 4